MADLLQEIYAMVHKLTGEVGELRGQVNMLVEQGGIQDDRVVAVEARMTAKHDALDERVRKVETVAAPAISYETRLRNVEQRQSLYAGAAGALGWAAGWVMSKIFHL